MRNLRLELSKLNHLITFEAAARADNFSRAADHLGVTRVSVSRQITELEEFLGTKLFHRHHRTTSLTQAGRALKSSVGPALNDVAATLQQIKLGAGDTRLSVTATAAFATYWLMPRIVDFNNKYPEVELNLIISDKYLDLDAENVDVAIRYPDMPMTGDHITPLFQETVCPVYSPKYSPRTKLSSPEDLLNENLLSLSGRYRPGAKWPNWFRQVGLSAPRENMGVSVNTYSNMIQAAIEGQGVALGSFPLVDHCIRNGSLMKVPGAPGLTRDTFYLVDQAGGRKNARLFCEWLLAQSP
ncbi:LysR substrate-binding domain-containing protein [Shimia gijangensis]|nr:LysR substrate-binding domain-containing protein [Shimia gijangensis]